ncbi:metal ABC transporter permease [Treponema sp.]
MLEIFTYTFMQRALIAGVFVASSCAVLGLHLILRRFSMIGEGLAHSSLATVALGLLLGLPPSRRVPPSLRLPAFAILYLSERSAAYGETAVALVSAFSIALAVLLASIGKGFSVDLFSYLFGSILAIGEAEVIISVLLSLAIAAAVIIFRNELFALAYDADFARTSGVRAGAANRLLALLTGVTVVLAVRVVGTMLVSALLVVPPVAALQLRRGFTSTSIAAALIAAVSVLLGLVLSFLLDLPSGATIVLIQFGFFALIFLFEKARLGVRK